MIKGLLAAFALAAVTTAAASAQQYPGPYSGGYGYGGYGNQQQQQMQGVVTSFNAFDLYVQSGGRQSRYVRLHQGTVINPRGTTLQNGMPVRVLGYVDNGGTFEANEVDVVNNNGNCGNGGGYGNGQYGSGYYNNGGGYASCNNSNNGRYNNGRRRHGDRDEDRDDRGNQGDRDDNRYQNRPYPYATYPPNR